MTTIAAGTSATIALVRGTSLKITGSGTAVFGPGRRANIPHGFSGTTSFGPYATDQAVYVTANSQVDYGVSVPTGNVILSNAAPDNADGRPDGTIIIQTA